LKSSKVDQKEFIKQVIDENKASEISSKNIYQIFWVKN
jgi:hypothetical protein